MPRFLSIACLAAVLISPAAIAQIGSQSSADGDEATVAQTAAATMPVAYVYVSNTVNQIIGFFSEPDGQADGHSRFAIQFAIQGTEPPEHGGER
jgi:hypothetical protein